MSLLKKNMEKSNDKNVTNKYNDRKISDFCSLMVNMFRVFLLVFIVLNVTNNSVVMIIAGFSITYRVVSILILSCIVSSITSINNYIIDKTLNYINGVKDVITVDRIKLKDIDFYVKSNNIDINKEGS